jgi:hypothetical protein
MRSRSDTTFNDVSSLLVKKSPTQIPAAKRPTRIPLSERRNRAE